MFQTLAEIAYIFFYCTTFQHKRQVVHYKTEKKRKRKSQLCIFTKKQSFSKKPVKSSNFLIIRLKVLQKDCQGKDIGKKGLNSKKGKLKLICTDLFKVWALG